MSLKFIQLFAACVTGQLLFVGYLTTLSIVGDDRVQLLRVVSKP